MFSFITGAGSISFTVAGAAPSPNLNAQLALYDGAGNLVTTANPGTNLGSTLTATVKQGTYYIAIDGVGSGSAATTGFSDYGSLGQYTLTGTALPLTNGGQPPVAVATKSTPLTGTVPLTVNFSSLGSTDPDGSIVKYDWDFGDGTTSTSPNPSHTYTVAGTYTPSLVVFDNTGLSSSTKLTVTAQPVVTAKSLHVADIKLTLYASYWYGYYVRADVTVKDQAGVLVPNATVAGTWSGLTVGPASAATGTGGVAKIWSDSVFKRGTFNFAVTSISLTGYTYAPTQNTKTQASISTP
jgi:PKD repeat protein